MTTTSSTLQHEQKDLQVWHNLIEQLAHQVEEWAKDRGWATHRDHKQIHESRLGAYDAPVLAILAPAGQINLDPIARYAAKSKGRVDMVAWPSLNRMLLIRNDETWKLKADSGIDWPETWSQQTFERLVELLHGTD